MAISLETSLRQIRVATRSSCFPSIAQNLNIELAGLDEFSGAIGAALLSEEIID